MIAEYKIKINTQDIERAQKVIHQTGGELQKLSQDEVVVKLKYDENKKEINQIIQKLYKTSPKLAVQVEYEMNKEALEKQRKKLNNMALTVDDSALINRIESLSKKYSTMLSNDAPQEQIDKLEKRLADLFATLFEKANGDYNILQKLSEEARNLYEDIPNLADGKSLSIISPEQYEKQANILESLKKKRDDLFKSGAVDSSIDKTTASMEDLMDVFSKFAVLNNNTNLSSFWDDLQTKVANGDNNLKSILSTLGLITDEAEELKLVSDGMVKSGGIIGEDNVLLATKGGKEKGRLADTLELQKRLIAAKEAGVEVSRILSVVYDEASDTFLELQEKAPGNILGSIYGQNDEDFVNLDLYKATDQQILKLIQDLAKLQELGLGVDINTSNIFYDKTKGFSFIDLDLNPAAYKSNIEFIEDAKMGIIGAIEEYYEIVGDSVGTQRIQELSQKFDKFFNAIIDQLGGESAFDSSAIQTVLSNLQVVGEQAGEAIIDGLRAGVDAHSNSKKAESVVDDVANGIVDEFEARTDDMQKAAQKSADAIADSFGERLKSGFDELDEVYSSLQDTNNVKKYTDNDLEKIYASNADNILSYEHDITNLSDRIDGLESQNRELQRSNEELVKELNNVGNAGKEATDQIKYGYQDIFDLLSKIVDLEKRLKNSPDYVVDLYGSGRYLDFADKYMSGGKDTHIDQIKSRIKGAYGLYTKAQTKFSKGEVDQSYVDNAYTTFVKVIVDNFTHDFNRAKFNPDYIRMIMSDVLPKKMGAFIEEFINQFSSFPQRNRQYHKELYKLYGDDPDLTLKRLKERLSSFGSNKNVEYIDDTEFFEPTRVDDASRINDILSDTKVLSDDLSDTLVKICDILGVQIPESAEKSQEALRPVLYEESSGQLSFIQQEIDAKQNDVRVTNELSEAEKKRISAEIPGQMSIFDFINKETDAKLDNVKATEAETVSIKEQIDKIKELGLSANDTENAIKLLQGGSSGFNWVDYEDHAKDYFQQIQQLIQLLKSFGLQVKSEENSDAFRTDIKTTTKIQERNKLVNAYIGLLKEEIKYEAELEVLQSRSGDQSSAIAVVENNLEAIREEKQLYSDLQLTKEEDLRKTNVLEKAKREASAKAAKALQDEAKQTETLMKKRTSLAQSMIQWLSSNPIAEKKYGPSLREDIDELNSSASLTGERINQIEDGFKRVKTAAIEAGETGKSLMNMFHQRFKSLITYLGTFVSFYRIIGTARSAITTIIELDTQLVDLRKTTKMNNEELERFYKNSSNIAKQLGVTTSEIISQAAAWSRLGYSTEQEATRMAELSSQFTSISPGMTTDNATDYLVSTMQAYGIAVDDVQRKIMDNVNRIGKILPKHMVTCGVKLLT